MATIVFDLGFAIVAFLAAVRAENSFELVAESHLESCDELNFGTIVDTRRGKYEDSVDSRARGLTGADQSHGGKGRGGCAST